MDLIGNGLKLITFYVHLRIADDKDVAVDLVIIARARICCAFYLQSDAVLCADQL